MTIGWRTPGAWAGSITAVIPDLPATLAAGDRMLLFVGCKPYSATIVEPAGWTRIGTQQTNGTVANGVDTGSVAWTVFYRDWVSGDAAPSVSVTSGNVALACIHAATKTAASWDTTTAYFGSDTTSDAAYSITASGSSGNITNGDGLIHFTVLAGNNQTLGTPTITATGATIGTVTESPTTAGINNLGNDLAASSASALVTAGTSTADAVCGWTLSGAQTGGSALVRLRESAPAQNLAPTLLDDSTDSFFAPAVAASNTLAPSLLTDADTFFAPTVTPGAVNLSPGLLDNSTDTFPAATVSASNTLAPLLLTDADTFFAATITPGGVNLSPSLLTDGDTLFAPTVLASNSLSPSLLNDGTDTFHAPTVAASNTISPSLLTDGDTFYAATVTPGTVNLSPGLLTDADSFHAAAVSASNTLAPSLLSDADTFYAPTVALASSDQTLSPGLLSDGDTFFTATASASNTLAPSLLTDADTFFAPTVSASNTLAPTLLSDADSFYAATVSPGPVNLAPSLLTDEDTFFSPLLQMIAAALQPSALPVWQYAEIAARIDGGELPPNALFMKIGQRARWRGHA